MTLNCPKCNEEITHLPHVDYINCPNCKLSLIFREDKYILDEPIQITLEDENCTNCGKHYNYCDCPEEVGYFGLVDAVINFRKNKQKEMENQKDPVNNPSHYTDGKIEVITFIEDKKLGFNLGNAIKYISRAGKKNPDKHIEDLEKAAWYLNREIQNLKQNIIPKQEKLRLEE